MDQSRCGCSHSPCCSAFHDIALHGREQRDHLVLQRVADADAGSSEVRNHITSIFDKLSVSSRAQAIVMAKEAGL